MRVCMRVRGERRSLGRGQRGVGCEEKLEAKQSAERGVARIVRRAGEDVCAEGLEEGGQCEWRGWRAWPSRRFLHGTALSCGVELSLEGHRVKDEDIVRKFYGAKKQVRVSGRAHG